MNLSDRRSLEIARETTAALDRDPDAVLAKALDNIARWRRGSGPHAHLQEWELIIHQGPAAVRAVLTGHDDHSRQLRSSSPFAGVLHEEVRLAAIERASAAAEA